MPSLRAVTARDAATVPLHMGQAVHTREDLICHPGTAAPREVIVLEVLYTAAVVVQLLPEAEVGLILPLQEASAAADPTAEAAVEAAPSAAEAEAEEVPLAAAQSVAVEAAEDAGANP